MNILLLSENNFRNITNVSSNIQSKFVLPAIRTAQDIKFQSVVGTTLYNVLLEKVADGSLDNQYKELVDKAQMFLAYSAIAELVVIANFKIDNIGINQTNDENARSLDVKDTFQLQQYYQNKADYYCIILQDFIYNNLKLFPEIDDCQCRKIHSNLYSAASCGMNLGLARGKNTYYNNCKKH